MSPSTPTDSRRLLPLILAISGMGVLTFALITPTLPDLAVALGVSRGSIGLIHGAVAVPGIFLAIFIGYLADLRGRRFVAVASLVVFGVAGASGFFMRSFWPLVIVRAVQGIGTSGILSLGVVVIGDLFPPGARRRWALGINSAGLTATGIFAPIVGGWLAEGGVFRPFLLFGLALPLAAWARVLPGRPDGPKPAPPLQHTRAMLREQRRGGSLSDYMGLLPFSILVMVVFVGFGFTVTPLFLERVFDVDSTGRGLIQAVLSFGASAGSLSAARASSRLGPGRVLSIALTAVVVGFGAAGIAPTLWIVGAALLLLGVGVGLTFPLIQDFVASSVPAAYRGAAVGGWISSIRLGQAVGPVVGAELADGIGERGTFLIAAGSTSLMVVGWRYLRRVANGWVGPSIEVPRPPMAR